MYLYTTTADYAAFDNLTDLIQIVAVLLQVSPGDIVTSSSGEKYKVFVVQDFTITVSQPEPLDSMGMCEFKIWKE